MAKSIIQSLKKYIDSLLLASSDNSLINALFYIHIYVKCLLFMFINKAQLDKARTINTT